MTSIDFTVPITPRGWARARKNGNRFFKDKQTAMFETAVGNVAMVAMCGKSLLKGPLAIDVTSYLAIPESWPKKKREAALSGKIAPTAKPDWDNLGKAVSDALNGIVYVDDAQIVSGTSSKFYAPVPLVRVVVSELAGPVATAGTFLKGSAEAG